MKKLITVSVLFLIFLTEIQAQDNPLTVMFYNTENLFDSLDDTLKDDDEFLPGGPRRWTYSRYIKKVDAISRVIAAAGGWEAPAVVGLCEIENGKIAYDLTGKGILADIGYSFIHYESPDQRGIDLCMLFRPGIVKIITHERWIPVTTDRSLFTSRDVLFAKTLIQEDTIDFIFCHWPSRRGGYLAASDLREQIASTVSGKIDSINKASGGREKIIMMGDFNIQPSDEIIRRLEEKCSLLNLSDSLARKGVGSYRYQGRWEMIDQVLVSRNLSCRLVNSFPCYRMEFNVFNDGFLLEDDPDYPGQRPFSTYREFKWQGGFSDHLPVILTLRGR